MTDNKEKREFQEIMDKIFGTEPSRYSPWNKELFLQMFNEAYAKGRQSVLDKIPTQDQSISILDTWVKSFLGETGYEIWAAYTGEQRDEMFPEVCRRIKDFVSGMKAILSKLSDDKGG